MNVLQIRGEFSDNGPGTQSLTIACELRSRGYNVVFCSGGGKLVEKIKYIGFTYMEVPEMQYSKRNIFNVMKSILAVRKVLKSNEIDIVHAHNAATLMITNIASIFVSRKIKFFQSVRGVEVRKHFQWRNMIYRLIKYDRLFAVCRYTKNKLISFGVPADRVIVTYNGVDLKKFDISKKQQYREEIRNEYRIPEDAVVVGIIGRQDGNKGHRDLIKAFSSMYDEFPQAFLILVGEGTEYAKNVELAEEMRIKDRVVFTGLRLDAEKLHAAFDVFVLFSVEGLEMFPNVIIESMSYGNPFIASDTAGVAETAEGGGGFICPCADSECLQSKLRVLLSNASLRAEMGGKAREYLITNFSIESVVDRIVSGYDA